MSLGINKFVFIALATLFWTKDSATKGFENPVQYPVGSQPVAMTIADLNHDGNLDLALADHSKQVSVLLANADGTFQPVTNYPVSLGDGPFLNDIAAGDFNEDGNLDLVVALVFDGPGGIALLFGNSDGTFQPAAYINLQSSPNVVAISDLNRDHHLDIWDGNEVLLGRGDGTFRSPRSYAVGANWAEVADLNHDNRPDLLAASAGSGTLVIQLGNGDGTFQPPQTYIAAPGVGFFTVSDFNADKNLDVAVVVQPLNELAVFLGNGDGTFQAASFSFSGKFPVQVAAGELSGDGKVDLAVTNFMDAQGGPGGVSLLAGNGQGTFSPAFFLRLQANPIAIIVKDLNHDHKPDLAIADYAGATVSILLHN